MPEHKMSISEAKARLSALVNRVAYGGERVILESHGQPKAAIVSLDDLAWLQAGGAAAARVAAARAEGLRRIDALVERMRLDMAGRDPGNVVEELRTLRDERDAELDRLR